MNQINREPASFGAALQEAAESFAVPQVEELHERAVRRGRQINRRRVVGASVSAAVAVVAVGALTFGLLGVTAPNRTSTASATASSTSAPMTGSQLVTYLVNQFKSLFPPGAQLSPPNGQPSLQASTYGILDPTGPWQAEAAAFIDDGGYHYAMELQIKRSAADPTCQPPAPGFQCTAKPLGRGTLLTTVGPAQDNTANWDYTWSVGGGRSVELAIRSLGSAAAPDPYTQQQASAVVSAPAWTSVVGGLPPLVHCPGGLKSVQTNRVLTGWSCASTGKTYPNAFYLAFAD